MRVPADDVGDGGGVLGRVCESFERGTGCSQGAGDAGLAGGLKGQEPGVMSTGEAASGF